MKRTLFTLFVLLVLLLALMPIQPTDAAQANPPAGLSADDWQQIRGLLASSASQQAYLKASNTGAYDEFGYAVAASEDTVVVGAYQEDSNASGVNGDQANNLAADSGAAYIFTRSGGIWSQQAYLKASNTEAYDYFGASVAISGDTVVIGAYREASNATGVNGNQNNNLAVESGAAYIFARNGVSWSQQAYLKASNTEAYDWFGRSVAISGDTVVVGAYQEASNATGVNGDQTNNAAVQAGAVYVFTRSGVTWSQQAYLKASNTEAYDWFGHSVSISGDTIVVGAYQEDSNAIGVDGDQNDNSAADSGAAYVFIRNGGTWSQQAYLKASNTEAYDYFGVSVAILGDTVVTGAPFEDSNATGVNGDQNNNSAINSGAAYIFIRSGVTWSQQAYLKASNAEANDLFGLSVAVAGNMATIGAPFESSNATGVNGNQNDNSANSSGAAYNFTRSGAIWGQQAYLKASNIEAYDNFGFSAAVSGDTVVVGAPFEDSNATGVGGDQNNNSAVDAGAVYLYVNVPNSAPTDVNLSASSVSENQPIGTTVGTLTTVDPDPGDTHTYTLACAVPGADEASFQISGSQLQTNASFDYETKNAYNICIRTNDGNGGTFDKNFTIAVTDIPNVELVSPENNEDTPTNRPTFRWNVFAGATNYLIQISTFSNFSAKVAKATLAASVTTYTPRNDLLRNTIYYWRVRAKVGNVYTDWSETWSFNTGNPPPIPSLVAPGNKKSVAGPSPLFDWKDVRAIAGVTFGYYEIQISTDANFSTISDTDDPTISQYNGFILTPRTYYWRVRSVAENGDFSAWSQVRIVIIQ